MNDNYGPQNFQDLSTFLNNWPKDLPLSVELRNSEWYSDSYVADDLCAMLQENRVAHTITCLGHLYQEWMY